MTSQRSLYDQLFAAKNILGDDIYAEVASRLVARWQSEHNNPILAEVVEGRTTFAEAFEPLVQANLTIDPNTGTGEEFIATTAPVQAAFKDLVPLNYSSLAEPMPSSRTQRMQDLRTIGAVNGGGGALFIAFLATFLPPDAFWLLAAIIGGGLLLLAIGEFLLLASGKAQGWCKRRKEDAVEARKWVHGLDALIPKSA